MWLCEFKIIEMIKMRVEDYKKEEDYKTQKRLCVFTPKNDINVKTNKKKGSVILTSSKKKSKKKDEIKEETVEEIKNWMEI